MRSQTALTVIELLISAIILVILLAIVGEFLLSSTRLTQETEVRNEMQVNIRSAMEMLSQDLFSAGSEGVGVPCAAANYGDVSQPGYALPLEMSSTAALNHDLTVRYCDPYTGAPTSVRYELKNEGSLSTLYRKVDAAAELPAVPGIVGLEFEFTCKPGAATCVPTNATFNPDDILSVKIKVAAQSSSKVRKVMQTCRFGFATSSPSCGSTAGYFYEYAEQDISPPNLRY